MPRQSPPDHILDDLYKRLRALEQRVADLENNKYPTVPIYDSNDFPTDAIEGQVVIAPVP